MKSLVLKGKDRISRATLKSSPVFWANLGKFSQFLAALVPTLEPPLLVISIPRSGSKWVASVLNQSPDTLYLNEPLTHTHMRAQGNSPSFFEVNDDTLPATFASSAQKAFGGLPVFSKYVVTNPASWSIYRRWNKLIVVKDVNPLALDWLLTNHNLRVIYLIRHPAAVANSFFQRSWTSYHFEDRFTDDFLESMNIDTEKYKKSFWAEHGALQSVVHRYALSVLQNQNESDYLVVKYEDLCANPVECYQELYNFANLEWHPRIAKFAEAKSNSSQIHLTGQNGVERYSQLMIDKWQSEIPTEEVQMLKEAYLSLVPPFYNREEDW